MSSSIHLVGQQQKSSPVSWPRDPETWYGNGCDAQFPGQASHRTSAVKLHEADQEKDKGPFASLCIAPYRISIR